MKSSLYPACAIIAWLGVLLTAPRLRTWRQQPARAALWTAFLFFALVFTAGSSLFWDNLDRWTGLDQASTLITQTGVVCFSASALSMLTLWSMPPQRARRRLRLQLIAIACAVIAMIVLFVHVAPSHPGYVDFERWYGSSVEYDVYLGVFLAVFSYTLLEITWLCWRFSRLTTPSWQRTGLAITAVGAIVCGVYVISRVTDIISAHLNLDLSAWEDVAEVGAGLGALLIMIGLTAPVWGSACSTARRLLHGARVYLRLRPLWWALYRDSPGIALDPPRSGIAHLRDVLDLPAHLEHRIRRRVIEIRDGILGLRRYLDAREALRAVQALEGHGLESTRLAAAIEAWQLRAALSAKAAGAAAGEIPAASPADLSVQNLAQETDWLLMVADAFRDPLLPRLHSTGPNTPIGTPA
jgi:hypothetical protein